MSVHDHVDRQGGLGAHVSRPRGESNEALKLTEMHTRQGEPGKLTAVASRSHLSEETVRYIASLGVVGNAELQFLAEIRRPG